MKPLVEPAGELTAAELQRYSRHLLLPGLGALGQRRLKNAKVAVIGAGGLGSPVLSYLAAAGVGTIGIIDDDVVEESNLQRQVIHGQGDLARPKVDSAAEAIADLNPAVHVVRHQVRLDASNALRLLGAYQLVLDGTDNFATRYLVSDACVILGVPLVWGSILRFDGQVSVFWAQPQAFDEPGRTPSQPLSYRDLHPVPPPPGAVPSCAEGGVLGVVCGAIGSVMATEAVKLICGLGDPLLGRLMIFDALAMSWRTIRVRPAPEAQPVTELLADYQAFCGLAPVEQAGAGSGRRLDDEITVQELAGLLTDRDRGITDFVLVDVREPAEREINAIPGAVSVPLAQLRDGGAEPALKAVGGETGWAGRRIVLHCKSGDRSAQALRLAREAGFETAVHVAGGVLAWIEEVDPGQPRY